MNVLFCTDGSKISYSAIQNFSHWFDNFTVDILCAVDWSMLPDNVAVENSQFAMQCANSADSILDYSEKYLSESGINIGKKIKMCGAAVDCVLEASQSNKYDYIVLGSHGKKGIQKWLGSVSQEVAVSVDDSVYISKGRNYRRKLLFTIESAEISYSVVKRALETFNFNDKDIQLSTVYEVPDYLFLEGNVNSDWIIDVDKKQENSAMLLLNEFEKMFTDKGLFVSKKMVLKGSPATQIISYVDKEDIDLVICGYRNRTHIAKFLISSVTKRVLENAKSDVLIIRP
ncbi:MAG: hypothetical protein E7Z87_04390 [Cyanobacteria bacterium SIG26]|nr:hypothetical protein [Cyanobacteria bacterium SIG26]